VNNPGFRKREPSSQKYEFLPWYVPFSASPTEPMPPGSSSIVKNTHQHAIISAYSVILVVASKLTTKLPILPIEPLMPILPAPPPKGFYRAAKFLPRGFSFNDPIAFSGFSPKVSKSQKIKSTATFARITWPRPPERYKDCFLRMKFQLKTGKPLRKNL